jgi:hypothetical protein
MIEYYTTLFLKYIYIIIALAYLTKWVKND